MSQLTFPAVIFLFFLLWHVDAMELECSTMKIMCDISVSAKRVRRVWSPADYLNESELENMLFLALAWLLYFQLH